jgi:hypothetical protein
MLGSLVKNLRLLRSFRLLLVCPVFDAMESLCDVDLGMKNGYFALMSSNFSNMHSQRMIRAAPGPA